MSKWERPRTRGVQHIQQLDGRGQFLASHGPGHGLDLWSFSGIGPVGHLKPGTEEKVDCLCVDETGKLVAACEGNYLVVWNLSTDKPVFIGQLPWSGCHSVEFLQGSATALLVASTQEARVIDLRLHDSYTQVIDQTKSWKAFVDRIPKESQAFMTAHTFDTHAGENDSGPKTSVYNKKTKTYQRLFART